MRSKSIVTLIAIIGLGVTLGVGGCRHRSDEARAQEGVESANVAPSDVKADAKAAKPEENRLLRFKQIRDELHRGQKRRGH